MDGFALRTVEVSEEGGGGGGGFRVCRRAGSKAYAIGWGGGGGVGVG